MRPASIEEINNRPKLTAIRARAGDPVLTLAGTAAVYPVYLELSRKLTKYELLAEAGIPKVRLYGETVEIPETTVEFVAEHKIDYINMISMVEAKGRTLELNAARLEVADTSSSSEGARVRRRPLDPEELARWQRHTEHVGERQLERERRRWAANQISFE